MPIDLGTRLLSRGYDAIPSVRSSAPHPDGYGVRLMGRRAGVVRGEEGARLFYDTSAVSRRGAMPPALAWLLFGRGAVHGLDGEEHTARKAIFLSVLDDDAVEAVSEAATSRLEEAATYWPMSERTVLFDELVQAYGVAVLTWAGLAGGRRTAAARARDLAAIVDGFGGAGRAYARAWVARRRAEGWAREQVRAVRSGERVAPPGSALETFAVGAGAELDERLAAVELLNVVRPTVAVAWLGCFAALALVQHPDWRGPVRVDDRAAEAFAQEVRRTTPFVPALAARLDREVTWGGRRVRAGSRLVLDVPGTDHDPRVWRDPARFDPTRFLEGPTPSAFGFVPQGGGHPETGHRCPGEPMTVELLKGTLRVLAGLDARLASRPVFDSRRIPTLPDGGVVLTGVRRAAR
jgi:fatty-acid peroxygenase